FTGAPRDDAGRLLAAVARNFGSPALAAAAMRLVPEHGEDHAEEVQRVHDEHVRTTLPVRLRRAFEQMLAELTPRDLDLDSFLAAAERTADRAGLLASDDPAAAVAHIRARGPDPSPP